MNSLYNKCFAACVKYLQCLGQVTGFTYVEISVIFNLWIQGGVLMVSGCLPFAKLYWLQARGATPVSVTHFWLAAAYALVNVVGFMYMCWHYRLPYLRAFNACVDDLMTTARFFGTTYNTVNIVIFVLLYLVLVAANIYWTIKI